MNWKDKFPKENRYFEIDNRILQVCKEALEDQGRMLFLLYENLENKL